MINAGASVCCQPPFRHQIEVLDDTNPLLWSSAIIFLKFCHKLFNGELITTIVLLVDDNSDLVWRARSVKHGKNHSFAKTCWKKGHYISPTRQIVFGSVSCSCLAVNNLSIDPFTVLKCMMGNQNKFTNKHSCKIVRFSSYFRSEYHFREGSLTVNRETPFLSSIAFWVDWARH